MAAKRGVAKAAPRGRRAAEEEEEVVAAAPEAPPAPPPPDLTDILKRLDKRTAHIHELQKLGC